MIMHYNRGADLIVTPHLGDPGPRFSTPIILPQAIGSTTSDTACRGSVQCNFNWPFSTRFVSGAFSSVKLPAFPAKRIVRLWVAAANPFSATR